MSSWLVKMRHKRQRILEAEWACVVCEAEAHDCGWWREEARRRNTDRSSLIRQRMRASWWVNAGRPPLAQWLRTINSDSLTD